MDKIEEKIIMKAHYEETTSIDLESIGLICSL